MKIYAEVVCYQLSFGQVSDNRSVFIKQYKRMNNQERAKRFRRVG